MTPPLFPDFKRVGLEDQGFIKEQISRFPSEACELNFGNIFIWRNFEYPQFTLINQNLCLLCEPLSEPAYFLPPVGENRMEETVRTCLTRAPRLSRVPESLVQKYSSRLKWEPDRDNFDYIYLAEDLIHLKGKRYDGKRNRIKRFEKNHSYRYLSLQGRDLEGCRSLLDEWLEAKSLPESILSTQKDVIKEAFAYFEVLGLVGGAVVVDNRIAAFSIGEVLSGDTAVIHIEIASPRYEGLSQLLNREFVKNELSSYTYINKEQDIGIPGLRRAKLSYHPHHLVKKFNLWAEKNQEFLKG